jgi:DNA mismatch endonuclease, patch repair protein
MSIPRSAWVATPHSAHLRGRRTTNTAPELALRKALHKLGLRYRLHVRIEPACNPDIVFPRYKLAIFVDGCLWHGCTRHGQVKFNGPNAELWDKKIRENRDRDRRANEIAQQSGWRVMRIWECDIRNQLDSTAQRVKRQAQLAKRSEDLVGGSVSSSGSRRGVQESGSWPSPARWIVQAVSRASCGVPVWRPVRRRASW